MADFNLGTVTAYGYAKDKGYTGTEDEFAELMASYAQVAEDAAESAEQAAQSATTATTKAGEAATSATNAANANTAAQAAKTGAETAAQTATTKADEASGSAATATTKAAEAATSATNAAESATTATTKAGEATTSATNAAASASAAAGSAQTAQNVADSIPEDYSQMSEDVSSLKEDLADVLIKTKSVELDNWGQGAIRPEDGVNSSTTYWCRTLGCRRYNGYDTITLSTRSEYHGYVIEYSLEDASGFVKSTELKAGESVTVNLTDGHCYRMTIAQVNSQPFAPSDMLPNAVTYTLSKFTDNTLSISGKAADAKAVGDFRSKFETQNSIAVTWQNKTINGTTGAETANGNRLSTVDFIPYNVNPINVSADTGYKYSFRYYSADESSSIVGTTNWLTGVNVPDITAGQFFKVVVSNDAGNAISISEGSNISITFDAYTDTTLTKANKAADAKTVGDKISELENKSANTIISRNNPADTVLKLEQLTMIPRTDSSSYGNTPLCLLHFSDIHNDEDRLRNVVTFVNHYSTYFDDILHTGDTVLYRASDGMSAWNNVDGTENILNTIGNHDTRVGDIWIGQTEAESFNMYFAPFISNWNLTGYTEGKCYYYKDYTDKHVRLIVLDIMHQTEEQLTWFTETLASALTGSLHVLVAVHSRAHWLYDPYITPWDDKPVVPGYQAGYIDSSASAFPENLANAYADAVDTFIADGGFFVAWIHGHTHFKMFAKLRTHTNQLDVAVANGGIAPFAKTYVNNRVAGNKSEDSFNVIAVDTTSKVLRIMGIGATYDRYMRHTDTISYNYETHELLYSNQ